MLQHVLEHVLEHVLKRERVLRRKKEGKIKVAFVLALAVDFEPDESNRSNGLGHGGPDGSAWREVQIAEENRSLAQKHQES